MALLSDQFQQVQALKMLKKFWPRLVFYQMPRRQNACSFSIMLMLGSKHKTTKLLNLLRTSGIWAHGSVTQNMTSRPERLQLG